MSRRVHSYINLQHFQTLQTERKNKLKVLFKISFAQQFNPLYIFIFPGSEGGNSKCLLLTTHSSVGSCTSALKSFFQMIDQNFPVNLEEFPAESQSLLLILHIPPSLRNPSGTQPMSLLLRRNQSKFLHLLIKISWYIQLPFPFFFLVYRKRSLSSSFLSNYLPIFILYFFIY